MNILDWFVMPQMASKGMLHWIPYFHFSLLLFLNKRNLSPPFKISQSLLSPPLKSLYVLISTKLCILKTLNCLYILLSPSSIHFLNQSYLFTTIIPPQNPSSLNVFLEQTMKTQGLSHGRLQLDSSFVSSPSILFFHLKKDLSWS